MSKINCPSCHELTNDPISCGQCGSTFCAGCQPDWDYQGEICGGCSEVNTIAEFKDDLWTAKLRRWFTRKLPEPVEVDLGPLVLPWHVEVDSRPGVYWICSGKIPIAELRNRKAADYTRNAANKHYQLCGLAVLIHNRIRTGDAMFDGSKEDALMWQKIRELFLSNPSDRV